MNFVETWSVLDIAAAMCTRALFGKPKLIFGSGAAREIRAGDEAPLHCLAGILFRGIITPGGRELRKRRP